MVRLGSMKGTFYFSRFGEFLLVIPAKRLYEPGVEHWQYHG